MTWTSTRKQAYDSIVAQAPAPAEAIQIMIDFEAAHSLTTPLVYISTAITSGGFRRDPRYSDPAAVRQAIDMNNAACARLMSVIARQPEPFVTADNVMVPTKLAAVPGHCGRAHHRALLGGCIRPRTAHDNAPTGLTAAETPRISISPL